MECAESVKDEAKNVHGKSADNKKRGYCGIPIFIILVNTIYKISVIRSGFRNAQINPRIEPL
jgi:hypothetical protein